MCFSAGASFGASVLIGAIGVAAVKKASTPAQKKFALIPIFFSIQQFSEGLTWLALSNPENTLMANWLPGSMHFFLFFAWMLWPVLVPYVIMVLETDVKRIKLLKSQLAIGALVSLTLAYVLIFHNVSATISEYHILYKSDINHPLKWAFSIFYVAPTVFSCFISSIKRMHFLGIINLTSYLFTVIAFSMTVTSVWCFFAAISSAVVLVIIYDLQKQSPQVQIISN
ncbi:MAG: hypothetical protein HKO56_07935 [Bacteroidia bacterium]|nr:hypothetical protein [Bacteroidia bacterium]NNC84456.1 hypothetical protein [Bacteroidia bacterium]NNM16571.1 hypothetical protein [Bacteroidia bacterium]